MTHNHVVIMAGGVGSRLYPVSTPEHPKQFLDLLDCGKTLIQLTYDRFLRTDPGAQFWVVTSANYTHFIREQLPDIPAEHILAEPEARNTAPCIAYACWKIRRTDPQANIVVTPADAYVPDCDPFNHAEIGILMRKEQDDLLLLINDIISQMKTDGTLRRLHDKYGLIYSY